MTLLLLVAAAVALWGWRTGQLRALRHGDVAAALAALIGASLLRHGDSVPALIALGGAGLWVWARTRRVPAPSASALNAARALLELPPRADAQAVRAAHRRLILRVHPDAGGSAELARQVNQARDILLTAARGGPAPGVAGRS